MNEKTITVKLENGSNFYFEGINTIKPYETNKFKICFRPLIVG